MARATLVSFVALLVACTSAPRPGVRMGFAGQLSRFGELSACSGAGHAQTIDASAPVVVLVHGCNASQGRFRSLSEVFALHGQQTLCFRYDDRRRISDVGDELARALAQLSQALATPELTLLGHSQGGLIARAAAVALEQHPLRTQRGEPSQLQLVTVSSPFNGIAAARDCGATWLHILSFGTTLGICRAIAGAKWREIHPRASQVRAPSNMAAQVVSHLEIRTDERNTCRRRAANGGCTRSDYVFSLAEQNNALIARDLRVTPELVRAGHAEIVGSDETPPRKLLTLLQRHQVLRATPSDKRLALAALLDRLF